MKRIFLAIMFDIIAIGGMFVFLGFPGTDTPAVKNLLQDLLCNTGETIRTESHSGIDSDGDMTTSTNFYCRPVGGDGKDRDVTGRAVLFGIVAFLVPFGISMLLYFSGGYSLRKSQWATAMSSVGLSEGFTGMTIGGSATDRLRALKKTYDEGLITESEYESKRQDILKMM